MKRVQKLGVFSGTIISLIWIGVMISLLDLPRQFLDGIFFTGMVVIMTIVFYFIGEEGKWWN